VYTELNSCKHKKKSRKYKKRAGGNSTSWKGLPEEEEWGKKKRFKKPFQSSGTEASRGQTLSFNRTIAKAKVGEMQKKRAKCVAVGVGHIYKIKKIDREYTPSKSWSPKQEHNATKVN